MKLVLRTLFFHFLNILIFTIIYYSYSEQFYLSEYNNNKSIYDFILLATTIQAGVGISHLFPVTSFSKIIITLQQWIMLCTHVITLYVFTI
jgi:hypothetical protein